MAGKAEGRPTCAHVTVSRKGDLFPCKTVAAAGSDLCLYHGRIAAEAAAADVVGGSGLEAAAAAGPSRRRSGQDLRSQLRGSLDEKLVDFIDMALSSEKTVACPKCRTKVAMPDMTARTSAAKLVFEQGYGRAPAAETTPDPYESVADPLSLDGPSRRRLMAAVSERLGIDLAEYEAAADATAAAKKAARAGRSR